MPISTAQTRSGAVSSSHADHPSFTSLTDSTTSSSAIGSSTAGKSGVVESDTELSRLPVQSARILVSSHIAFIHLALNIVHDDPSQGCTYCVETVDCLGHAEQFGSRPAGPTRPRHLLRVPAASRRTPAIAAMCQSPRSRIPIRSSRFSFRHRSPTSDCRVDMLHRPAGRIDSPGIGDGRIAAARSDSPRSSSLKPGCGGKIEEHVSRRSLHVPIDQQRPESRARKADCQMPRQSRFPFPGDRTRDHQDS